MKISFLPAGNEDTASSRIRVYAMHTLLNDSCIGFSYDADVIFVQKKVTRDVLAFVEICKRNGKLIIYDVDDLGSALEYWAPRRLFERMVRLADVITTDTCGHRDFIKTNFHHKHVELYPPCIDYYPVGPVRLSLKDEIPLRILWFGSLGNIALFEKYVSVLAAIPDLEIVVVAGTSRLELKYLSSSYPKITFVPWSLSSFISILQSCHLSCLMHDGSDIDRAKSNNRMITSIAWGVPAVVSRTPAYERTAIESGIDYAIFETASELDVIIGRLRSPVARNQYLDASQGPIWDSYSPDAAKQNLLRIVEAHLKNKLINTKTESKKPANSMLKAVLDNVVNFIRK